MTTKYKCSCGKKACMKCGGNLPKAKNGGTLPKYNHGGLHYDFNGQSYGDSTADTFGGTANNLDYSFGGQSITNDQGGANAGHYSGGSPYATTEQISTGKQTGNTALVGAGIGMAQSLSNTDPNATTEQKVGSSLEAGANGAMMATPWGQYAQMGQDLGKSFLKYDEQGNPQGTASQNLNDWMTPTHTLVTNEIGKGNYAGALREATMLGATGRSISRGLGLDDKDTWYNKLVGIEQPKEESIEKQVKKPLSVLPQNTIKREADDTLGWFKFGGSISPTKLNSYVYKGATHGQGGINVNAQGLPTKQFGGQPVAEVEGGGYLKEGETMARLENGGGLNYNLDTSFNPGYVANGKTFDTPTPFVFSNKLKLLSSKKTFAELHKPLVNMEKRMAKNYERVSSNSISRETKNRMDERIANNTKALAQEQEQLKMMKDMGKTKVMKNGGKLPKYELGSENEYDWSTNVGNFIPESNVGGMSVGSNAKGTSYNPNTNYNMWQTNDNGFNIIEPQYKSSTYNTGAYVTDTPTSVQKTDQGYVADYSQTDSANQGNPQGQGINWGNVAGTVMNNIGPAMQIAYQNRVANQKLNKDTFSEIQNPRTAEALSELDSSEKYAKQYEGFSDKYQQANIDRARDIAIENAKNVTSTNRAMATIYGTTAAAAREKNRVREHFENLEKNKKLQLSDYYNRRADTKYKIGANEQAVKQNQENQYTSALANQTKYRDAMYSNMGKLSEENQREKYQWAALEAMSQYYKVDPATGKTYFDAEAYNKANS